MQVLPIFGGKNILIIVFSYDQPQKKKKKKGEPDISPTSYVDT